MKDYIKNKKNFVAVILLFLNIFLNFLNIFSGRACADEKNFLPPRFDLREYKRVTSPKFQNIPGPCWAFAALGACESNYLTQKFNFIKNIDLSEMHLAYSVYKNYKNNFTPLKKSAGFFGGGVLNKQGNVFMSAALLSRLDGPLKEREVPYSMQSLKNLKKLKNFTPCLRVTDVFYMSLSSRSLDDKIKKNLIKNHGAIVVSFYSDWNKYNEINKNYTYYNNLYGQYTTHDVILIGWDDNFSRENFRPRPSKNGAWLAKNSWGTGWGVNKGYFWISYEQYLRGSAAFIVEPYDKKLRHYGHDDLGWCENINYNFAANVFKIRERREFLSDIAFYTTQNNASYKIYIYDLGRETPNNLKLKSKKLLFQTSGKIELAGYHTIKLNSNNIYLNKDQYFAVVINLDCPVACETKIKGYSENFEIKKCESFFSTNGEVWVDGFEFPDPANACIKAFTRVIF